MRGRLKNLLFFLIIIVITIEVCPYIISPIIYNKSFSREQVKIELLQLYKQNTEENIKNEEDSPENEYLGGHILHPYLGFVSVPKAGYNRFCFPGIDPLLKQSDDQVNICIMGGSVALGLYSTSKDKLINTLKSSEFFKDKKINVVLFALGGYKQPQQLMALNYFLSLGAHYDMVINLDGFNEIVLPYADNLPFNVSSSYPRHWNMYSRKKLDSKVLLLLSKQTALKDGQSNLNKFFMENKLHNSNFGLLLWNVLRNKKKTSLFGIENELRQAINQSEADYQSTGPKEVFTDTIQFFMNQAETWQRSSKLIWGLGKSEGIEYFHFLQPNQYVEKSKKLTKDELKLAYEKEPFAYKKAVQTGYPILVNHGKQLKKEGVNFVDLTLMFKTEKRMVYNDKCCHFNELGYNLIAEKISTHIITHIEKSKTVPNNK
jgi:hypothetical protein